MTKPVVYFTKEITPDSLIRIYERLGKKLSGKIGVKISTGEPDGKILPFGFFLLFLFWGRVRRCFRF